MDNNKKPASYKCQTCCNIFKTKKQLEIHIDSYQRLMSNLFFQVTKAAAHLTAVIEDQPEADPLSLAGFDGVCPLPSCGHIVPSHQLVGYHFSHHVGCYEICPGCSGLFNNANAYLTHSKLCLSACDDAAKTEQGLRRGRALVRRTLMRFRHAMNLYRPGVLDRDRNGNGESVPRPLSPFKTPVLKQEEPPQSFQLLQPQAYGTAQWPRQAPNGPHPYEARQPAAGAVMPSPHGSIFTPNTDAPESARSYYPSPDGTDGTQALPAISSQLGNPYEIMPMLMNASNAFLPCMNHDNSLF